MNRDFFRPLFLGLAIAFITLSPAGLLTLHRGLLAPHWYQALGWPLPPPARFLASHSAFQILVFWFLLELTVYSLALLETYLRLLHHRPLFPSGAFLVGLLLTAAVAGAELYIAIFLYSPLSF